MYDSPQLLTPSMINAVAINTFFHSKNLSHKPFTKYKNVYNNLSTDLKKNS